MINIARGSLGVFFMLLFLNSNSSTHKRPVPKNKPNITFPCDTSFIVNKSKSGNLSLDSIYDSLNNINYSKIDIEIHVWTSGVGQVGNWQNVFVLRHFTRGNKWMAYCYNGYKYQSRERKSFADFFKNAEISPDTNLNVLWDKLVDSKILTIQIPPTNQMRAQSSELVDSSKHMVLEDIVAIQFDGNASFEIQIFTQHCKRHYSTSDSYILSYKKYSPDLREFKNIIGLINRVSNNKFY